jgi:ketosteroid isomerase-like protein
VPEEHDQAVKDLRDADQMAQRSVIAKDPSAVREWLADNARNYGPFAPAAEGREDFLSSFEGAFSLPGFAVDYPEPSQVYVSPGGDVGYTVALEDITVTGPDGKPVQARARYLAIWERQPDGRWLAIENMWNFRAPAPSMFLPPPESDG